jgi:spermidine/putrescine transport system permease protein
MKPLSAFFIFGVPLIIIAVFWLWSVLDRRAMAEPKPPTFFQRNGGPVSIYLILAVGFWSLMLIIFPLLYMVDFSFHPKLPPSAKGGPRDVYTLANYNYFLFGSAASTASWNVTHLYAFWITLVISVFITLLNLVVCYPIAFYMAQVAQPSTLRKYTLLLITPYWVNEILRAFAFFLLFGSAGFLNKILMGMGLLSTPIDFIGKDIALYAALTYAYLLLMLLPLYNAIEALDRNQIEAARDLGAPTWRIHKDIVIPFAKPGIASGCTLVFMLAAGALAAPQVLGGPKTLWFTPIVYDRFYQAFNWNQGSAYALILLLACVAFVLVVMRLFKVSFSEITR